MTWLTLWLKKIILLVLLAAFLDLILPNTSLQRYVKMVMGLIILMTIISPVFALFQLSQDDLALKLDRYQQEMNRPSDTEWRRMAERLAGQQDKQISAYVESQVEAAVRTQLKQDFGVEAADVKVAIGGQGADEAVLKRIEVSIRAPDQADSGGTISPIQPIAPVHIEVGGAVAGEQQEDVPASAQSSDADTRKMARELAAEWGLTEDQVIVTKESGGFE